MDIFGIYQGNIGYDGNKLVGLGVIHLRIVGFQSNFGFGIYLGNLGS